MAKSWWRAPQKRSFLPPSLRGIAIDLCFMLLNLFALRPLASRFMTLVVLAFNDDQRAIVILSLVVLGIAVLRIVGLHLKRFPLQARLKGYGEDSPLGCLSFFGVGLSAVIIALAFAPLFNLLEEFEKAGKGSGAPGALALAFGMFVFIVLEWMLVLRALTPLTDSEAALKKISWRFSRWTELFADFCLFAYMFLWQILYNAWVSNIPPWHGAAEFRSRFGFLLTFLVMFCLFYLSPRLLYLVEDSKHKGTWASIGLAFLPTVFHLFR